MSEYPCTGIDKAILKFGLQDSKISQNVSVKFPAFFLTFVRQLLPNLRFTVAFFAFSALEMSQPVCFLTKLVLRVSSLIFAIAADEKIRHHFFD
ncbi:hypothetical protein [Paraburkholderia fungorum]|uniref:hypothetical protein n=1 Tax=Paraburkholderia fungorum TaxID=134537 RepID=UPI0011C35C52|nr:hypothetical protein [Paraburkholderia fungorum]